MEAVWGLGLTLIIEVIVAVLILHKFNLRFVLLIVALNLFTHPIAWTAVAYGMSWMLVEGFVVIIECLLFIHFFPDRKWLAVVTGIVMNIMSGLAGLMIESLV